MENAITILTDKDKAILNSYIHIAEGTAEFWGENCEVVVHNLARLDSSVMKIVNGHLSGRQAGFPISEVTLSFVNKMLANPNLRHVTYFAKNKRGDAFKASISAIEGEKGNIIGLFCINFYLTGSLLSLLQNFTPNTKTENENISETFVENAEELMLNALEEAKKSVYDNLSISSSNKNKEIVAILYQKGIFNLKDSVITIANHLGISKNTVYMHIRNMNK
ncbi:helix-turn-helix transcriptional regulator [Anaerotignum sp.]